MTDGQIDFSNFKGENSYYIKDQVGNSDSAALKARRLERSNFFVFLKCIPQICQATLQLHHQYAYYFSSKLYNLN